MCSVSQLCLAHLTYHNFSSFAKYARKSGTRQRTDERLSRNTGWAAWSLALVERMASQNTSVLRAASGSSRHTRSDKANGATHLPENANFLDPRTRERHALPPTDQGTVGSTSCLDCLQNVRRATSAASVQQQGPWQCLFRVHR